MIFTMLVMILGGSDAFLPASTVFVYRRSKSLLANPLSMSIGGESTRG